MASFSGWVDSLPQQQPPSTEAASTETAPAEAAATPLSEDPPVAVGASHEISWRGTAFTQWAETLGDPAEGGDVPAWLPSTADVPPERDAPTAIGAAEDPVDAQHTLHPSIEGTAGSSEGAPLGTGEGDWHEQMDPATGGYYYYNAASGSTQWEPPAAPYKHLWKEALDTNSGSTYYMNTTTGETTWEPPPVAFEPHTPMPPAPEEGGTPGEPNGVVDAVNFGEPGAGSGEDADVAVTEGDSLEAITQGHPHQAQGDHGGLMEGLQAALTTCDEVCKSKSIKRVVEMLQGMGMGGGSKSRAAVIRADSRAIPAGLSLSEYLHSVLKGNSCHLYWG